MYGIYRKGEGFLLGEWNKPEDALPLVKQLNYKLYIEIKKRNQMVSDESIASMYEPYIVKEKIRRDED